MPQGLIEHATGTPPARPTLVNAPGSAEGSCGENLEQKGAILVRMEAGVRELRDHLSRYLELVRDGHEVTVTDHGKAVARIVPLDQPRPLDRLIAEGLVTPVASRSAREVVEASRPRAR